MASRGSGRRKNSDFENPSPPGEGSSPGPCSAIRRVILRTEHRPEDVDRGQLVDVAGGSHQQAGGEFVGRIGGPSLPGLDDRGCVRVWPDQVQRRRGRRRDRPEDQQRHDSELTAASAAQRPEQVVVLVLVALHDATVRQDHLRADELVAGEPVLAAQDAEPATERQSRDPDGRPATRSDRNAVRLDLVEPCPGAHGRNAFLDRYGVHRADVDDDPSGGGAAREAVPSTARRRPEP